MAAITEPVHAGEFVGAYIADTLSIEVGTVKVGEVLVAGQVVMDDGTGKIVAHDGALNTAGDVDTAALGIIWDAVDASAAEVPNVAYVARLAEVKDDLITYPEESTAGGEKAAVVASLKALHIRPR
ncbi:MAG: head decoration protein [Rhodospirillaceae bacterium]